MSKIEVLLKDYTEKTKYILLSTVDEDNYPKIRPLASYAVLGTDAYFTTGKTTAKVTQIEKNPKVAILFQNENQDLKSFLNITLYGKAQKINDKNEINKIIPLISEKSPNFKSRVEKNDIGNNIFFKVKAEEVKIIDFTKGTGPLSVEVIKF
jgi:pyridoxamine 5'-phosphate oxidase